MKTKWVFVLLGMALGTEIAFSDIAAPSQLNCAVAAVRPEGANFFGFGKGPVLGDTLTQDFNVPKIRALKFASGAMIGSAVIPHELEKLSQDGGAGSGYSMYEVRFQSQSNGNNYIARLSAVDDQQKQNVLVRLDVVEIPNFQLDPLQLHSIDMNCRRGTD